MSEIFVMFWEFFKTGLFALGGGMATIPFLYDMARRFPWFSREIISDMIAISESTPGPIGVNVATYAGYSSFGVLGGIVSTIGLVLPSVIVVLIIAKFLDKFGNSFYVNSAFYGIRPVVTALVALAGLEIFKDSLFATFSISPFDVTLNIKAVILFAVLLVLTNKVKIHPIFYILFAAFIGIIFNF